MSCPICSKGSAPKYRPFCSRRCADVDLGRWLNGSYAVPVDAPGDADETLEELAMTLSEKTSRPH